jgi:PAS domain S-box-containing protein
LPSPTRKGRIIEVNNAFCATSGFSASEVMEHSIEWLLKSEEGIAGFAAVLLSDGAERLRVESTGRKKSGEWFVVLVRVMAIEANEASIDYFIIFIADVAHFFVTWQRTVVPPSRFGHCPA